MHSNNFDVPIPATAANQNYDCLRHDGLTAQKVDVGVIFQEMLGTATAAAYLAKNKVPMHVALRVLTQTRRKAMK